MVSISTLPRTYQSNVQLAFGKQTRRSGKEEQSRVSCTLFVEKNAPSLCFVVDTNREKSATRSISEQPERK
jgi:hypothetical protein